jgi:alpha-ketoglutarate-dependent taurine dioxygenase
MSNEVSTKTAFNSLAFTKRKRITVKEETLVQTRHLDDQRAIPLVLEPSAGPVKIAEWATVNEAFVAGLLRQHGALLFRGFGINTLPQFEEFARSTMKGLMEYAERSSPRSRVGSGVYTSTNHPAKQEILLHNEQSYTLNWPMKISFGCLQPAAQGGATPIADCRRVLARLRPVTVKRFEESGVMYERHYGEGLGLPWQEVFQTQSRAVVEEHCRRAQIEWEWKDEQRLRTVQVRPAIRQHPISGERTWFNHGLFFHVTSLSAEVREQLQSVVATDAMPYQTRYGDGAEIEPEVLAELRAAYEAEKVRFTWQAGDVLLLENMLVAHGRDAYEGERRVVVAMAEEYGALQTAS